MELRRWLRGVAIALGILVAIELGLRLAGPGAERRAPPRFLNPEGAWAASGVYCLPDPDLFWRLRPRAWIVGGWYRTNADGFRGAVAGPRRQDVPRVVLFGDSVTFGLGVDDDATYGALLEPVLEARLGKDVEVLSRAVPGYSSLQVARLASREIPRLRPDLVVVLAGAFNDQAPACGVDDAEASRLARTRPGPLRRLAIWRGLRRLLGRDRAPTCPPMATEPPPPGSPAPKTRVSVRDFGANLRRIVDDAGRVQAAVIVVVPPISAKIAALQPWALRYRRAARGVGGCRTVDAARTFEEEELVRVFQPDELHPSPWGHVLLASDLAQRISLDHTLGPPIDERADPPAYDAAKRRARMVSVFEGTSDRDAARAIAADPAFGPRARFAAARAILRTGRTAEAESILHALERDRPELVDVHQLLAECAAARGDAPAAIRALETGVRRDRGWIHGRALLARALRAVGRDDEAVRWAKEGLRIAPEDRELLEIATER